MHAEKQPLHRPPRYTNLSCPALRHRTTTYPTLPYLTLPYPTLPHSTPPYPYLLFSTLPYPILPFSTLLYYSTLPYSALLYPTLPYSTPTLSDDTPSKLTLSTNSLRKSAAVIDDPALPPTFFKSAIVDFVWSAYSVARGIRHTFSPVSALTWETKKRAAHQAKKQANRAGAAQEKQKTKINAAVPIWTKI